MFNQINKGKLKRWMNLTVLKLLDLHYYFNVVASFILCLLVQVNQTT